MKDNIIKGRNGYDIPCVDEINGNEDLAVVISHGFGSSKKSPAAVAVAERLEKMGIGTCRFDFPAHGESPVNGDMLRIDNCLRDIAAVEEHVLKLAPKAEICYFSSSFGAYMNIIYLASGMGTGKKSFLRCAAVNMPGIMQRELTEERVAKIEKDGFLIVDLDYMRPLKITKAFLEDIGSHDVFEIYVPGTAEIAMIHGTADKTAMPEDARRFASFAGAQLTEVEGADHIFMVPGGMETVVETAADFFSRHK